jgi:hypothetical protein
MNSRVLPAALAVAVLSMTGCGTLRNMFSCKGDPCGAVSGPPPFVGGDPMMGPGCGDCCGSYGAGYMGEAIVSPPSSGGWQTVPSSPPMGTISPGA